MMPLSNMWYEVQFSEPRDHHHPPLLATVGPSQESQTHSQNCKEGFLEQDHIQKVDLNHHQVVLNQDHPPGHPAVYLVTRDVIVMDLDTEKVPSRSEKQKMEQERQIISGFDKDRWWNGIGFEIVKNRSGSLVKPNIPRNKATDSQLLFRSVAPSEGVYVRLLAG